MIVAMMGLPRETTRKPQRDQEKVTPDEPMGMLAHYIICVSTAIITTFLDGPSYVSRDDLNCGARTILLAVTERHSTMTQYCVYP